MVWRGASEAVGGQVNEGEGQPTGLEENLDTVCRGWVSLSDRQHAGRDKRAVLAALTFLTVRTARHVSRHSSHIAHLADRRPLCRNWGYQRRSYQPHDRNDRGQPTDESEKIHSLTSHKARNFGRGTYFTTSPDDPRQETLKVLTLTVSSKSILSDTFRADKVHKGLSAIRAEEDDLVSLRDHLHPRRSCGHARDG